MKKYQYWLHRLPGVGDALINRLLNAYGTAMDVYFAVKGRLPGLESILGADIITDVFDRTESYNLDLEYEKMLESGIAFVPFDDPLYPTRLKSIPDGPYAIYYLGNLPDEYVPSVAIIGARNCSEYGKYVADAFGTAFGREGVNVISGMAFGIDGIAQRGAVKGGGKTFAVLGCGVDICYPKSNLDLYEDILKTGGGIISCFPPGTQPIKNQFPERNKIVAALSDMVLVIEARRKSGTSITVDLATKMNKDVYAVPGRITDRLSDGCNTLIRDGAGIALSPEDVINELHVLCNRQMSFSSNDRDAPSEPSKHKITHRKHKNSLADDCTGNGVLKYVDAVPRSVDEIHEKRLKSARNKEVISFSETQSLLVTAAIEGKITQVGSGYFYRKY